MEISKKKSVMWYSLIGAAVLGIAGVGTYIECSDDGEGVAAILSAEDDAKSRAILAEGYANCRIAIAQRGAELERAILARSVRTEALADELTGLNAMWKCVWNSEAELNAWISGMVKDTLYNENETSQQVAQSVAFLLNDWNEQENAMAMKLGRPVFGEAKKGKAVEMGPHNIPAGMNRKLMEQIFYTIGGDLAGEAVGMLAANMAVTSGILSASALSGWATFGISAVAGGVVAYIVNLATDPSPQIEAELNNQLAQSAAQMRRQFETSMQAVLDERVKEWNY